MPRTGRSAPGGKIYHVLNRGNGRCQLFHKEMDYAAFLKLLFETREKVPLRILAWCLMPNHWHLVLWPKEDGRLSRFMLRLTTAHVRRHHAHYHTPWGGHLYQGRFKSFVVQDDGHFLVLCRYVEANALRGGLVRKAEHWRWGSLWACVRGGKDDPKPESWPLPRPADWVEIVNAAPPQREMEQVRTSVRRGRPLGSEAWVRRVAGQLGLEFTLRDRGRPRKPEANREK